MDCNSKEGSSLSLLPGGVDWSSAASLSPENSSSSSLSSLATATRTNIFVSRVVSSPIFPLEAAAQAPPPPPPLRVVSLPPKTSDNSLVFSKQLSLPASWPKMGNDAGILEVARPNVSDDEAAPLPQQKQRSEAQVRSSGPRTKKTQKKKKKQSKAQIRVLTWKEGRKEGRKEGTKKDAKVSPFCSAFAKWEELFHSSPHEEPKSSLLLT
jgi:hypothetical protein